MEIKREIVESKSEVSKDNLWLKPEGNKKKLLYYGIKGWTELVSGGSSTPSNPDDKIDFSKLTTDELLELNKNIEEIKEKLPPEEYARFLVANYDNLQDIKKNWRYYYKGEKTDTPYVAKVLNKGDRLQVLHANPDLYIEVINDYGLNYQMLQTIINSGINAFFNGLWSNYGDFFSEVYELQNGEVKYIAGAKLYDYIKIVDKSVEDGNAEITDGFKPIPKSDTIILPVEGKVFEHQVIRSLNNIIQDYGKYVLVREEPGLESVYNKYKVVSTAGFSLMDYRIIFNSGILDESINIRKKNTLEFIEKVYIKHIRAYREHSYSSGSPKVIWRVKSGNKFYLGSQPHIVFTALADDIKPEDLEKIVELDEDLIYFLPRGGSENFYTRTFSYGYVEEYYPPYEDYKKPQDTGLYEISGTQIKKLQELKKKAEESKNELASLLKRLEDKIQYSGELIITRLD